MDATDWAEARPIFQQLGTIRERRNAILHQGAISVAEDAGMVTNAFMAHMPRKVTGFTISRTVLEAMTADLRKIILHMHMRHMGRPPLRGHHPEIE